MEKPKVQRARIFIVDQNSQCFKVDFVFRKLNRTSRIVTVKYIKQISDEVKT